MKIWVELTKERYIEKIGDSILLVPLLNYFVSKGTAVEYGPAVNPWVSSALPKEFISNKDIIKADCAYVLNIHEAWKYVVNNGKSVMHVINGLSYESGLSIDLDFKCPFFVEDVSDTFEIVIAPFSKDAERVWQFDKWLSLIDTLPRNFTKAVIGAGDEDYTWVPKDIQVVTGRSLPYIAGLLSSCKLFISEDSGPSNLANVLGIQNHVLIYPHRCGIIENIHAKKYKVGITDQWRYVTDIPVDPVIEATAACLKDFKHVSC